MHCIRRAVRFLSTDARRLCACEVGYTWTECLDHPQTLLSLALTLTLTHSLKFKRRLSQVFNPSRTRVRMYAMATIILLLAPTGETRGDICFSNKILRC